MNKEIEIINKLRVGSNEEIKRNGLLYSYSFNRIGLNIPKNSIYRKEFNKLNQIIRYKEEIVFNKNEFNITLKMGFKPFMTSIPQYIDKTYIIRVYFIRDFNFIDIKFSFYSKKAYNEFIVGIMNNYKELKAYDYNYINNIIESKKLSYCLSYKTEYDKMKRILKNLMNTLRRKKNDKNNNCSK